MRTLAAVTVAVVLAGCALPSRAPRVAPTYAPDAHTALSPRSAAYHRACAKKDGHVIGQECHVEVGGGSAIVPIFVDEEERERRP